MPTGVGEQTEGGREMKLAASCSRQDAYWRLASPPDVVGHDISPQAR